MAVRYHTAAVLAGPVAIDAATTVARSDLVRVVDGEVVAVADAAVAGLAVALDPHPDAEYEEGSTAKGVVQLCLLGEDCEVEMPFSGAALTQAMIGASFGLLAAGGGTVNLANTTNLAFQIRRLADGTALADTTGTVVGVFLDSVSF